MRQPDLEIVQMLTLLFVRTPLLVAWLRRDERSMSERDLERAWHPVTRDLASLLIGSLALLVHSVKARRSWRGLARGLLYVVVCEAATAGVLTAEEALLQRAFPTVVTPRGNR